MLLYSESLPNLRRVNLAEQVADKGVGLLRAKSSVVRGVFHVPSLKPSKIEI